MKSMVGKLKVGIMTRMPGIEHDSLSNIITAVIEKIIENDVHELIYDVSEAKHIRRISSLCDILVPCVIAASSLNDPAYLSSEIQQTIIVWFEEQYAAEKRVEHERELMSLQMNYYRASIIKLNKKELEEKKEKNSFGEGMKKGAGEQASKMMGNALKVFI